jgi:hypothetical protein
LFMPVVYWGAAPTPLPADPKRLRTRLQAGARPVPSP